MCVWCMSVSGVRCYDIRSFSMSIIHLVFVVSSYSLCSFNDPFRYDDSIPWVIGGATSHQSVYGIVAKATLYRGLQVTRKHVRYCFMDVWHAHVSHHWCIYEGIENSRFTNRVNVC